MWVSYPHMPTGAQADYKFLNELVTFARNNNILLVNDNPYSFILTTNPRSILKVNRSKEFCLELNSLSKTFNMAGWRVGMILGHERYPVGKFLPAGVLEIVFVVERLYRRHHGIPGVVPLIAHGLRPVILRCLQPAGTAATRTAAWPGGYHEPRPFPP